MELISAQRRNELVLKARERRKLELRDNYAVDEAVLAAWRRGDVAAVREYVRPIADRIASQVADGVSIRRIKVLSEPPSEYMRHALDVAAHLVDAGEDTRWLPRRLCSDLLLPGNDFFLLDGKVVIFNVLDGDDGRAEQQLWTEPEVVERCRSAFESAWARAVPHRDYHRV
jgi:hypothetical protein